MLGAAANLLDGNLEREQARGRVDGHAVVQGFVAAEAQLAEAVRAPSEHLSELRF